MATLKDIRRRILSVKNTQKITRAMKLVSAAKFARANTAVVAARPYGQAFDGMVRELVAGSDGSLDAPITETREEKRALVVLIGTDRGFCGSLNANLFRTALHFIADKKKEGVNCDVMAWGKRSIMATDRIPQKVVGKREKVLESPSYDLAKELAADLTERFVEGDDRYDRVYLAFMKFENALSQKPTVQQLLPVGTADDDTAEASSGPSNLLVEPDLPTLLESVLNKQVALLIFRTLLEGAASEHGARMTAMDSATNNADEVLRNLSIEYNRARQAAITKELIEITTGAQAL